VSGKTCPRSFVEAASSRRKPARLTAALLGHVTQRGRLRLRGRTFAASAFGDLDFDLREATIDRRQTTVTVLAAFGNVDVYVPEGVNVDVSGIALFGHRRDWGRDAGRPDAPAVQVRVLGLAGTIDVWRVPHDMRDSSYSDIVRRLEDRQRQLPA
jgi:Cell wall-active antibiotics response LiaF, C-terminal